MRSFFPRKGTPVHALLHSLIHAEEERPCTQDPELWWMTDYKSVTEAKALCLGTYSEDAEPCPLLHLCGRYAVVAIEKEGVWGGMSPDDRLAVRRTARHLRRAQQRRAKVKASAAQAAESALTTSEEEEAS